MAKASSHFSMDVILGRFEVAGRGIVTPWAPTWRWSWEFRASLRREEMGRRVAKSTYSPFVMAVVVVFVKWLASEGWRKSGWRAATLAGSDGLKAGKKGGGVATLCCCCWLPLEGLKAWMAGGSVATLCCCGWPPSWVELGVGGLGTVRWDPVWGLGTSWLCCWPLSCRAASFSSINEEIIWASSSCGRVWVEEGVSVTVTSPDGGFLKWVSRRATSCWRVPVWTRLCWASRRRRASVAIDR